MKKALGVLLIIGVLLLLCICAAIDGFVMYVRFLRDGRPQLFWYNPSPGEAELGVYALKGQSRMPEPEDAPWYLFLQEWPRSPQTGTESSFQALASECTPAHWHDALVD